MLNAEIVRVRNLQKVRDCHATFGREAVGGASAGFAEVMQADTARFSKIIKTTGAMVE